MASITGYGKGPVHVAPRPGDLRQIRLDSSRAFQQLGWRPQVRLDDGLKQTIDFLRATMGR
jgi:UDP-glucose 4-epimerase